MTDVASKTEKVVVDAKPLDDKTKKVDPDSQESSAMPYHTANTEKIFNDRAKKDAKADKAYSYEANGYSVTERDAEENEKAFASEEGKVYDIEGNDLPLRTYGNKREAEIWVETHAPHFAQQSATMPSA